MSKLRQGVVKRGSTWSYVVRIIDPETGKSRPKWRGGFATEEAAKAARDEARVAARRGEYVDRSALTVREYLDEWIDSHAATVKPGTAKGYRDDVERYIVPRRRAPAAVAATGDAFPPVPRALGERRAQRWSPVRGDCGPCTPDAAESAH